VVPGECDSIAELLADKFEFLDSERVQETGGSSVFPSVDIAIYVFLCYL